MKYFLFFITSLIYSNNLDFVTNPNGLKVYKDSELNEPSFIPYQESFEVLEENRNTLKIKYKENELYLKLPLRKKIKKIDSNMAILLDKKTDEAEDEEISFNDRSQFQFSKKYFYSANKINLYSKPFLDSKTQMSLDEWKIYELEAIDYRHGWIKINLNNEKYYLKKENIMISENSDNLEGLKTKLEEKRIDYHFHLVTLKGSKISFTKKNKKLIKNKILPKGNYSLDSEIILKGKKYYQISKNKIENLYIEANQIKKISYEEFSKYSFENSKWRNDSLLKKVFFTYINKFEYVNFFKMTKKEYTLGKDRILHLIKFENPCLISYCGDRDSQNSVGVILTKNNKITYKAFNQFNKIMISDFDNDKIPELIFESVEARAGSGSTIFKFTKNGIVFIKSFFDDHYSDLKIKNGQIITTFIEDFENQKPIQVVLKIENNKLYAIHKNKKVKIDWDRTF